MLNFCFYFFIFLIIYNKKKLFINLSNVMGLFLYEKIKAAFSPFSLYFDINNILKGSAVRKYFISIFIKSINSMIFYYIYGELSSTGYGTRLCNLG